MYTGTTKAFQDKVTSDSRTFRAKLVCGSDVIDSGFRSLKMANKSIAGSDTLELGAAVAAQLDVTVKKPGFMVTGREFQLYIGLILDEGTEYVPMGKFTPQKPKETDNGEISFTAYDRMVSNFKSAYFTDIQHFPVDGKKILQEIQDQTGIKVVNLEELPNGIMIDWRTEISDDTTKTVAPFSGYTYSETIGYLAQLYGRFATMNRLGNLEFRWYKECDLKIPANRIISDIESAETVFSVQKIECSVADKTLTAGTGTMGITMSNPVMTQEILNTVYKSVSGMEYLPVSCTYLGDPRLELGDIVQLYRANGITVKLPIMSIEFEYDGGFTAAVQSMGSEKMEDVQKGPMATAIDRVYTELFLVKSVVANKVSADYVEANYIKARELDAVSAKIQALETDNTQINNSLTVMENAQVTFKNRLTTFEGKVNINSADITTLKGNLAEFQAGDFKDLSAEVGKIHTLIYGTASGESISSQFSNSVIANAGTAVIKDAMIESLSVGKIQAGKISTTKFQIGSDSGNMFLSDNTMQIKDTKRTRIQIGKDASGDYNMYVWDKTGNLMFDALGLTEKGIQRSIIRNDMVSDDANISAEKLDIGSLFDVINTDGSHTLKASRIYVDADKQTLDVAFKQMTTKVSESVTTASTAKTTASNAVTTANSANSTANAAKSSADSALSKANTLETTVSTLTTKVTTQGTQLTTVQGQISSKIWQQDITTSVSEIQIGGRNLVKGQSKDWSQYWQPSTGTNVCRTITTMNIPEGCKSGDVFTTHIEIEWTGFVSSRGTFKLWAQGAQDNGWTHVNPFTGKLFTINTASGSKVCTVTAEWDGSCKNYEIGMRCDYSNGAGKIRWRRLKIEKGNKATDWTPALEDLDSSISTLEGTTTTLKNQYTTINQDLSGLKTTVNSNTTAISKKADGSTVTALQGTVTSLSTDLKGFKTTVSDTYATKTALQTVDGKFASYSTTTQMNSAINQKADSITTTVSKTYTTKTEFQKGYRVIEVGGHSNDYAGAGAFVKINGNKQSITFGRGLNVVAMNISDLSIAYKGSFDTFSAGTNNTNFNNKIAELNKGNYIIAVVSYDASYPGAVADALKSIGGMVSGGSGYRESYALIGRSGLGAGNGIEMYVKNPATTKRQAIVSAFISENGAITGANSNSAYTVLKNGIDTKTDKNSIISTINQTPEAVKIGASKIELTGAVTFSCLDSSTQSIINTTKSTTDNLNKVASKSYSLYGANGKKKWVRLGILKSAGDASVFIINLQSGGGYNGSENQNSQAEIVIKDGWQGSASASAAFGVSVTRQNCKNLKVKVLASASDTCEVWVYMPWDYWNGIYTISGRYASWNASSINQDAEPTNGTVQSLGYRVNAETIDSQIASWCYNNDRTYINGAKIYTGTVTANAIAAKAVTAEKLSVSSLSAISANLGTVTAGTLNGCKIMVSGTKTYTPDAFTKSDVEIIDKLTLGLNGYGRDKLLTYDVNGDGKLSIADLAIINNTIKGKTHTYKREVRIDPSNTGTICFYQNDVMTSWYNVGGFCVQNANAEQYTLLKDDDVAHITLESGGVKIDKRLNIAEKIAVGGVAIKFTAGTKVCNLPAQADNHRFIDNAEINKIFGVSNASNANTVVFASNGDFSARSIYFTGTLYLNGGWHATWKNQIPAGLVRINYFIIYWG